MSRASEDESTPRYDRNLLLHGAKRNDVLTLAEVERYGADSYDDADYVKIYGETPARWYGRGIRLLGRTAVECTRDELGDRIGRDIARVVAQSPANQNQAVVDPFAGSCNTLFWILQHLPAAQGFAFELDPQVYGLTLQNLALLGARIELRSGDYQTLLPSLDFAPDATVVAFIAPPWGRALDESKGLDLSKTIPPIKDIIGFFDRALPANNLVFAIQVFQTLDAAPLAEVLALMDWSELCVYDLNAPGKNHGLLLGTRRWVPQDRLRS